MFRFILAALVLVPFAASAQKTEEEKNLYALGYILGKKLEDDSAFASVGDGAAGYPNYRSCAVLALPFCGQSPERCGRA